MGNSESKKKKGGVNQIQVSGYDNPSPHVNGGVVFDSLIFLKRAHELKEEGNRKFQSKDYVGALAEYDNALKLIPKTHPVRAVFHSNRAACLMQMRPIDYEAAIAECTMALQVQPRFVRALLRRARAFEAIGKYEMAVLDMQALLGADTDTNHRDALDNRKEQPSSSVLIRWRPLKLVYDHDIRISWMPVNCSFRVLREIVSKRFPSLKSVLIKYKDDDGDLVTITCTDELRLAESFVDSLMCKEPETDKFESVRMLRLHIVEVDPEQEPHLPEEEEEGEKPLESGSHTSMADSVSETVGTEIDKTDKDALKEKPGSLEDPESKEVGMDDWLFEFAQLFRTHVGIDPDTHIDLHELGLELCSEALEETVTGEPAQTLFDKASMKFQEVAALAFFNWGNVHMCAARKRIPIDESAEKELTTQLQSAYDWVKEKYSLAREKYEEALLIKPDFYEGLLALGQQQFEMAKLHWSFVLAKKEDLSKWDFNETMELFDSAEEKMKAATEMWEKLEEERENEVKDPSVSKKEELLKKRKKQGSGSENEILAEESIEQAAVMRSQIHLFWGNMLFERSQVECKLGLSGWKKNLDSAVERFKLAGASGADISVVLKNHCLNAETVVGDEKMIENLGSDVAN